MIKKMLAMLVAISCAFGAWADTHISGTDFTGLTAGPFALGLDDEGQASNSTFWYNGDPSDFEGTIVPDGLGDNYLDFESNITNPLYRTINDSYGLAPSSFQATPIGTGLFIDTHVQFTPYLVNENHPAPTGSGEDKLIVWVRETEVDGDANLTNLIVTAGYVAGNGIVTASNYVINLSQAQASDLCSGQHRLTIKSYENITDYNSQGVDYYIMGFVVYIDEAVVDYPDASIALNVVPGPRQYYSTDGHNKLFASLMPAGSGTISNYSKLSAVGYAGMGKIGDVIFDSYNTTYPAFAGDDLSFEVRPGDGVTSFDYLGVTYNGGTNCFFTVDATATSVTISNVLYDTTAGYKHKTGTWHNNVAVDNQVGVGGDYGTFLFANGTILTLVGFQANYIVNGEEYDNLTEAKTAALTGGYPLVLNNNVVIDEGTGEYACCLYVADGETLVLDLNGHTIKGSGDLHATIVNDGGTLTIIDTSSNHDGKVLNGDSEFCLVSYTGSLTTLNAGIYEDIDTLFDGDASTITIGGGSYKDVGYDPEAPVFYLEDRLDSGKEVIDWIQISGDYYAVIGEPSGDTWDITFSTNNVIVTEWNLTVNDGSPIGNHIPNFTGGSWDAPAPTAETIVTSDTNFNYTIAVQLSYFPQKTIEEQWADRDGTAAKPFVIRNDADFAGLKSDVADGYNADKYFEVVVDNITLTDWVGIGTSSSVAFAGTLNGNGKTVNVTFAENKKYNGLFCFVNNATISNLTVNVTAGTISGETAGAAFVGKAYGSCTFETLKATGSLGASGNPVNHNTGGICAQVNGSGTMNFNSCTNAMNIFASYKKVGGILATREVYDTAQINFNNCVNTGNITNSFGVHADCNGTGGLMGWTGYANPAKITIANCSNTGNIASPDMYPGNYVGYASAAPTASGVNVGLASLKPTGNGADATSCISGLNWATVSGDIATFVTPVATVDSVVAYKVMQANSSPNFTLAAAAASLTIITNLCDYAGTVSVDSTLTAQGYELVENADANGVTFTCAIPGPADPWAPAAETDEAAAAKAVELFGAESEVAANVDTLAEYNALVTYIKSVTSQSEVPTDLTADQKTWMWKSFILGANPLFDAEPAVQITSLTANSEAGKWDFIVKVTEGELTTAHSVAAAKVAALVKVTDSLSPASWSAPDPEDVHADLAPLLGTNLIKVTVDFGTDTSGFMKVSE